ncbi:MAG: flippase-like domain-containing protein [Gammaproteobacteria bacterium]|nr:flippase-like domain-containing protein [Gammaproteobacteria bacterium]
MSNPKNPSMNRWLWYGYVALGSFLLAWVIANSNLDEVLTRLSDVGIVGFAVVLLIYATAFALDATTWLLTLESVPIRFRWIIRLFGVRLAGEAFNEVLPGAGMGGEPLKAVILKRRYAISLHESMASIILIKTLNMMSLIAFVTVGFAIIIVTDLLPKSAQYVAITGLVTLVVATGGFLGAQQMRLSTRVGRWLARSRFTTRFQGLVHHFEDMDDRLGRFYDQHRGRVGPALALGFLNWFLGVAEVYFAMMFLGHPIDWATAWVIESVVQMVRIGVFFIPAGIGVQESAFVYLCTALTGNPSLGLAVSAVRRIRELAWIALGFVFAWWYGARRPDELLAHKQ